MRGAQAFLKSGFKAEKCVKICVHFPKNLELMRIAKMLRSAPYNAKTPNFLGAF